MIKKETPLSMPESLEYLKNENTNELKAFIKKFTKLDENGAKELKERLIALDLIKLNDKHIAKIIDVLPEDKEALNNLLQDANLDEKEITDVLQTIKN